MLIDSELSKYLKCLDGNKYEASIDFADKNILQRIVKFNNGCKLVYGENCVVNISDVLIALVLEGTKTHNSC